MPLRGFLFLSQRSPTDEVAADLPLSAPLRSIKPKASPIVPTVQHHLVADCRCR
jgi:hypothetical protein